MKTFLIMVVFVGATLASKLQFHHHEQKAAEEEHHLHYKGFTCRGEPVIPNEEYEKSKMECMKEIRRNSDSEESEGKKSGRACRAVCALAKVGALDEMGLIVESKFKSMISSAFVNHEAGKVIEDEILACARNTTDLGIASSDEKCSNYKPFLECAWHSILVACIDPHAYREEDME